MDIAALIVAAHQRRIRFFADMVMAFGLVEPMQTIDLEDFYIDDPNSHPNDPDAWTSGDANGHQAVLAYTMEADLVERFGASDQSMLATLRFVAPPTATAAQPTLAPERK